MWKHANLTNHLELFDPVCHEWNLTNGKYKVKWYEGSMLPGFIIPPENEENLQVKMKIPYVAVPVTRNLMKSSLYESGT